MAFLTDAHGALAPGVNGATLALFNAAALGTAAALAALLATPAGWSVWPHVAVVLVADAALIVGVNWAVSATGGLVDASAQRAALFGEADKTGGGDDNTSRPKDD